MKFISFFCCLFISFACQATAYNSQASQDKFVDLLLYNLTGKTDQGFYLEIGAADPIYINNTYYFEKKYGWNGISLDISSDFLPLWISKRTNSLKIEDATTAPYADLLTSFPQSIDYLSLDVDGYYDQVLQMLPHDTYTFKVITIEHDAYRYGDTYRSNERRILNSLGYHLLCGNVSNGGFVFEDWWVHPSAFSPEIFEELSSLDLQEKDHLQIIKKIRDHFGI